MQIKIHRGENQIGGNIVEISTEKTRILLDIGCELEEPADAPNIPDIPGLFENASYDAVFISHYHADHAGLASYVDKKIPIYMGEKAFEILRTSAQFKGETLAYECNCFSSRNKEIQIGDIIVRPYLVDHSAFDAYMFLIEADGEKILYTGDFRANGRKSFDALLSRLPQSVDVLICEGTTTSREDKKNISETELEEVITELCQKKTGPVFVLQAATNIDRIVTMYRSAKKSNRIFLEDVYMAGVAAAAGKTIPNPKDFDKSVRAFIANSRNEAHYQLLCEYGDKKIGQAQISKEKFVMCIRSSMQSYLRKLSEKMDFADGVLIYSMWEGYKEKPEMRKFLDGCKELGLEIVSQHVSGHADTDTIKKLIDTVHPQKIMPIHTENADWFKQFE